MVQATLKSREENNVHIEISVPAAEVDSALKRVYNQLGANRSVAGFRKGKVPRHILNSMFSIEGIQAQAMQDLLPEAYSAALKQLDLIPVAEPDFEPFPEIVEGQDLLINVKTEVLSQIVLPDISSIEIDLNSKVTITPEDVEETVQGMRKRMATFSEVDRPCAGNDRVHLDYEIKIVDIAGKKPDEDFDKLNGLQLNLGDGELLPEIEKNIIGMKAGESKTFVVKYPDEYQNAKLSGKNTSVTVTMHKVEERALPEIDAEFLKKIGGFENEEDMRKDVAERMTMFKNREHQDVIRQAVVEKVMVQSHLDVPDALVDEEVKARLDELKYMLQMRGESFEAALAEHGDTEEQYMERERTVARESVKRRFVFNEIYKREGLTITSDEMSYAVAEYARRNELKKSEIRQILRDGDRIDELRSQIKNMKVVALLSSRAKFKDAPAETAAAEGENKA